MTEPRRPAVAGSFYPADGAALAHAVEGAFLDPRGPGELPTRHRARERTVRAIVVPHAGYVFSGPIAARAYRRVAADAAGPVDPRPWSGPLRSGSRRRALGAPWMTPLGVVPGDPDLSGR